MKNSNDQEKIDEEQYLPTIFDDLTNAEIFIRILVFLGSIVSLVFLLLYSIDMFIGL